MWDAVSVGAGLSGLACAVQLKEAGYRVTVVEKSRGVGGRAATRRIAETSIDHGAPTLSSVPQDQSRYGAYISSLTRSGTVKPWPAAQIYEAITSKGKWYLNRDRGESEGYIAPAGMSAIAKVLAKDLEIHLAQQVITLRTDAAQSCWQIFTEPAGPGSPMTLSAKAVVLALPPAQILDLCQPLPNLSQQSTLLEALRTVTFDPCISVMAGYAAAQSIEWSELRCSGDPVIRRILCDSRKRSTYPETWFVLHSMPAFAARHQEDLSLEDAGRSMLEHLGNVYLPWMARPTSAQVHRWRYALASDGSPGQPLSADDGLPLWCCGDWCTGSSLENAFNAGLNVARRLQDQLAR